MKKPVIYALIGVCLVALTVAVTAAVSMITEQQAVSIAGQHVTGIVQEVELETMEDRQVYEVDITYGDQESEVTVDAHTGEVLGITAEEEDFPITGTALEQASVAALRYVGEGRVTDTEVGDEEGYYEIEVTLDNGHEVDVHLDENFNFLSMED